MHPVREAGPSVSHILQLVFVATGLRPVIALILALACDYWQVIETVILLRRQTFLNMLVGALPYAPFINVLLVFFRVFAS